MIKLIASDMDGTLLNEESKISDKVLEALELVKQKNVLFFLATGREYDLVEPVIKEYNLDCGQILMNGAEIRDKQGKILQAINLDKAVIAEILKISDEFGLFHEIYTDKGMYTTMEKDEMIEANVYRFHGFRPDFTLEQCKELLLSFDRYKNQTCIYDMEEFLNSDIQIRKLSCFHSDLARVEQAKQKIINNISGIATLSFFPDNIEITDLEAQKGIILKKVVKDLGIDPSEVAIMGDSYNDISLFEEFEHSFAMGNAVPEVKQIAKYIVSSNKEDGAVEVILKALSM